LSIHKFSYTLTHCYYRWALTLVHYLRFQTKQLENGLRKNGGNADRLFLCLSTFLSDLLSVCLSFVCLLPACMSKHIYRYPEAVVFDNCTELHLSENSGGLESDFDSSLTCVWQRYNSEQASSHRQWPVPPPPLNPTQRK
jgi:hypothetical protein